MVWMCDALLCILCWLVVAEMYSWLMSCKMPVVVVHGTCGIMACRKQGVDTVIAVRVARACGSHQACYLLLVPGRALRQGGLCLLLCRHQDQPAQTQHCSTDAHQ
jgi:hypothetical protein